MWSRPEFERLAKRLHERIGLTFPENRLQSSECSMLSAMREMGCEDLIAFEKQIGSNVSDFQRFINIMVVGETYFQRENTQIDCLTSTIVPRLMENNFRPRLKIWCAGCSTGEEAYTLAAQLMDAGLKNRFQITATDISTQSLAHATRGQYSKWSFRAADEKFVRRYFEPVANGWSVNQQLRENVRFRQVNLLDADLDKQEDLKQSDIIFCRNVLIYFDRETVDRLTQQFYNCLSEGGWMVTSVSDPPLKSAPFELQLQDKGRFYRKSELSPVSIVAAKVQTLSRSPQPIARSQTVACAPTAPPSAVAVQCERMVSVSELFARGEWQTVVNALTTGPSDEASNALIVRCLTNLGHIEKAQLELASALDRHPLSTELWFLQSMLYMEKRDLTAASQALKKVIYLDRSIVTAHFTLAVVQQILKEDRAAIKSYENVLKICSQLPADQIMYLSNNETADAMTSQATKHLLALRGEN